LQPEKLPIRIHDGEVTPRFLGDADVPWIRALIELVDSHLGAPWRDLEAALRQPVLDHVPRRRQALAVAVLRRLLRGRVRSPISPRRVRAVVFDRAAVGHERHIILAEAGERLGLAAEAVERALFADLPSERHVVPPETMPTPIELALQANLFLCRTLLTRAVAIRVQIRGNARSVVRTARLRGLLCTVIRESKAMDVALELSGPLSLFRRTTLYGRALGAMLPSLAWCDRFDLLATLMISDGAVRFRLQSGDPFLPAREGKRYDSAVEERLARDLHRFAPSWAISREPEPVPVGRSLIFPDFALFDRHDPARRWLLEIVGFWTPDYLANKLRLYNSAGIVNLILCVDERLSCADGDLPRGAHIIRYKKRVVVEHVLRVLENGPAPATRSERRRDDHAINTSADHGHRRETSEEAPGIPPESGPSRLTPPRGQPAPGGVATRPKQGRDAR
jgi:predicted nuclease of restriction endonuclease-like RecB superfamily